MTVIAYRAGVIASDSLMVGNGHIMSRDVTKIGKQGPILYGATGDAVWCKAFHDWMRMGLNGPLPKMHSDESGAMVVMPDGVIVDISAVGLLTRRDLDFWAIGCGGDYAMGAMGFGASAEEACHVAITWNALCGGAVKTLSKI